MSTKENRLYERYEPSQPTYVYLGPEAGNVGRVTGIGQGGLGFDYVDWQSASEASLSRNRKGSMDLVVRGEGPRIKEIPFELVYEKPAADPFFYWAAKYRVMSCGIKFGRLSPEQKKAIDQLLGVVSERPSSAF